MTLATAWGLCTSKVEVKSLHNRNKLSLNRKGKQNKEQLPNITPHILRHTFCTRLANAGMNPKALQYIMGHANITMTLNYYAHATYDSAKAEMEHPAA